MNKKTSLSELSELTISLTRQAKPLFDGLFCVEAIGADETCPNIMIFRKDKASAERWIKNFAPNDRFSSYLLKYSSSCFYRPIPPRWTIYDKKGENPRRLTSPPIRKTKDSTEACKVDREALLDEAREFVGDSNINGIKVFL